MSELEKLKEKHQLGGEWTLNTGYVVVYCPTHPNVMKDGSILKHRLIMSAFLQRPLKKGEIVHHINEDKTDNNINNLKLLHSDLEHSHEHHTPQTKEERREKQYEWRRKNPDKVKAIHRRFREKHRLKRIEYNRKYRKLNREKLREYDRKKYAERKLKLQEEKAGR